MRSILINRKPLRDLQLKLEYVTFVYLMNPFGGAATATWLHPWCGPVIFYGCKTHPARFSKQINCTITAKHTTKIIIYA